jgi:hypothetical protein
MTQSEFESSVIPFLDYIWKKTHYYDIFKHNEIPFALGNLVLVCSKSYIPDQILVLNESAAVIDGFELLKTEAKWNSEFISDIIERINNST